MDKDTVIEITELLRAKSNQLYKQAENSTDDNISYALTHTRFMLDDIIEHLLDKIEQE